MRLACDLQDTQVELESERQVSEASQAYNIMCSIFMLIANIGIN